MTTTIRYVFGFCPGSVAARAWAMGERGAPIPYAPDHVYRTIAGAIGYRAERDAEAGQTGTAYLFEAELTGEVDHKGRVMVRRLRIINDNGEPMDDLDLDPRPDLAAPLITPAPSTREEDIRMPIPPVPRFRLEGEGSDADEAFWLWLGREFRGGL